MWTYRAISEREAVRTEAPTRSCPPTGKAFLRAISIGSEVHEYLVLGGAGCN